MGINYVTTAPNSAPGNIGSGLFGRIPPVTVRERWEPHGTSRQRSPERSRLQASDHHCLWADLMFGR